MININLMLPAFNQRVWQHVQVSQEVTCIYGLLPKIQREGAPLRPVIINSVTSNVKKTPHHHLSSSGLKHSTSHTELHRL